MELWKVRLDLTLVMVFLSKVKMMEVGFLGTFVYGKLPNVKERPAMASIYMVM